MSEPFIAEIRIFGGNFAPRSWANCDGQLLPIAQNTALFSIVGTTYGGDGRSTLGLPDLQGRGPVHPGNGPGLRQRRLGEKGGTQTVTLNMNQMPSHTHAMVASGNLATNDEPVGQLPAATKEDTYSNGGTTVPMSSNAVSSAGGNQAHNNLQPYLVMRFIIALQGLYPSRS
jgi:microcystin-dependent protein